MRTMMTIATAVWLGIGAAQAQVAGVRGVVASGGRVVTGSGEILRGTVGQPMAGRLHGATVSCAGGFWYTVRSGAQAGEESVLPACFFLAGTHPNPFAVATHIDYHLPTACDVTFDVFDAQGRLVRRLIDQHQPPGAHTTTLLAEGLAAGLYVCRMKAGTFRATRPMVMVR